MDLTKEAEALDVLINSEWFTEELENANYHSLYGPFGFLEELRKDAVAITNDTDESK